MANVFLTGGTGYMGQSLVAELIKRQHRVRAVVRKKSKSKLPAGSEGVVGDALDARSYADFVTGCHTFIHLVGVAHPSPAKAAEFRSVDLASIRAALAAAQKASVVHFIYVSVVHPAPMMKDYIAVRMEGEAMIHAAGLAATIVRPWYVLGPGHRWPLILLPMYWVMERLPKTRAAAQRLGLVSLRQMVMALANAVDSPATGVRIVEVPEIRRAA